MPERTTAMSTEFHRLKALSLSGDCGNLSPYLPIFRPANLCNDLFRRRFRPNSITLRRAFGCLLSRHNEPQGFLLNLKSRMKRPSCNAHGWPASLVILTLFLCFSTFVTY